MTLPHLRPDPYKAVMVEFKKRTGKDVPRKVVKMLFLKWLYTPKQEKR